MVTYTLNYGLTSVEGVTFDPPSLAFGGISLTPLAVTLSQHFTGIAFEVTSAASEGGRNLKLVNQSKPEKSTIAVASPDGTLLLPTDTSLDGRLFSGVAKVGIVTFEPFGVPLEGFLILIDTDDEPLRLQVTAPGLRTEIEKELAALTVLETFTTGLRQKQSDTRAQVDAAKRDLQEKAKSGCVVILAAAGAVVSAVSIVLVLSIR